MVEKIIINKLCPKTFPSKIFSEFPVNCFLKIKENADAFSGRSTSGTVYKSSSSCGRDDHDRDIFICPERSLTYFVHNIFYVFHGHHLVHFGKTIWWDSEKAYRCTSSCSGPFSPCVCPCLMYREWGYTSHTVCCIYAACTYLSA